MAAVDPSVANGVASNSKGAWGLLNHNVYATKKTVAQGMLDVALLTANASQLKYLLQVGTRHEFYHLMLVLISTSIALQILIGVVLLATSRYNINKMAQQRGANFLNNFLVWLVFFATVANIFIGAFGIDPSPVTPTTTSETTT